MGNRVNNSSTKIGFWAFALSHHFPEESFKCYHLNLRGAQIAICARCVGLYPMLMLIFAAQFSFLPFPPAADWPLLLLLPLPALIDWSSTRLTSRRGHNWLRTITGALLGIALGRAFAIYVQNPLAPVAIAEFALLSMTLTGVELLAWRQRRQFRK